MLTLALIRIRAIHLSNGKFEHLDKGRTRIRVADLTKMLDVSKKTQYCRRFVESAVRQKDVVVAVSRGGQTTDQQRYDYSVLPSPGEGGQMDVTADGVEVSR